MQISLMELKTGVNFSKRKKIRLFSCIPKIDPFHLVQTSLIFRMTNKRKIVHTENTAEASVLFGKYTIIRYVRVKLEGN